MRLIVGGLINSEFVEGGRRIFVSYPSSNFDLPEQLYGVFVNLHPPISQEQVSRLRDRDAPCLRDIVYVEVGDRTNNKGEFSGVVAGCGNYPNGTFKRFKNSELNPSNYSRL